MKMMVTGSFKSHGDHKDIDHLCALVREAGFEDFSFIRDVENYQPRFTNPKALMDRARAEIQKCDALLIDLTDKPTGRAYEAGIAYAFNKKIIVVMKKGTKIKETTLGIADLIIEYDQIEEIIRPMKKWLESF